MNFNDDIQKLEQEAKKEGWDKKAEQDIEQRLHKGGNNQAQQSGQANNQPNQSK